jgi:hypothetical protein
MSPHSTNLCILAVLYLYLLIHAIYCAIDMVYQAAQGGQKMLPTLEVMLDDKIAALAARQAEDEVKPLITLNTNNIGTTTTEIYLIVLLLLLCCYW